ncbi:LacI family DNA-binding transcriptional regulator [Kribbella sp. NPDC050124]|uniref:LacI family DNA-binding transcriptional regulator n=1 Tax=Kribbella sp. NPDC050124 TaxID=3364114 RepID=UPI0037ABB282
MPRRAGERRRLVQQPSMADVAAVAGVSAVTVSRVVNGHASVTPETRERVEQAMKELGYRANTAAQALATGRFGAIGVVSFDLTATGNLYIVDAVIREAQQAGYGVNLATLDAAIDARLQAAVRRLTSLAIDGLVVVEARILDAPSLRLPDNVPVVVAEGASDVGYPAVGADHGAGATAAVEHLLNLGHRTVHHVTGLADSYPAVRRKEAWQRALRRREREIPPPVTGDWTAASGYAAGLDLLRDPSVTAIFAANDQMAAGVLRAATELGRRVPEDLSVVGYDDAEVAAYLNPPLTTVRQDLVGVGKHCVDVLLTAMRGEKLDWSTRLLAPELVIRSSTAPPA